MLIEICYNSDMEDKRIKLICTEMFIAWGIICWIILLIDMEFWHLGRSVFYISCPPNVTKYPIYSEITLMVLNISCIASALIVGILSEYIPKGTYLLCLLGVLQVLIYWYIGNLSGRFIVWVKSIHKKTEPESSENKK